MYGAFSWTLLLSQFSFLRFRLPSSLGVSLLGFTPLRLLILVGPLSCGFFQRSPLFPSTFFPVLLFQCPAAFLLSSTVAHFYARFVFTCINEKYCQSPSLMWLKRFPFPSCFSSSPPRNDCLRVQLDLLVFFSYPDFSGVYLLAFVLLTGKAFLSPMWSQGASSERRTVFLINRFPFTKENDEICVFFLGRIVSSLLRPPLHPLFSGKQQLVGWTFTYLFPLKTLFLKTHSALLPST